MDILAGKWRSAPQMRSSARWRSIQEPRYRVFRIAQYTDVIARVHDSHQLLKGLQINRTNGLTTDHRH